MLEPMKNVLYMHGGSGNHGCEAIVRTSAKLLGSPKNVVLWSLNKHEDEIYGVADHVEKIITSEELRRFSPGYFEALFRRRILRQSDANMNVFLRETFQNNIAISIGGDNYCYPWSAQQAVELNHTIRKYAHATVLWACSIDPEAITPQIQKDLAGYSLITAREPITYELLKEINPNTIRVADPAFTLDRVDLPLPEGFINGNTVGINVSPLIMDYGPKSCLIIANYEKLINYIIDNTDMNICLIPHVVWEYNDDRTPCRLLYDKFKHTGRICIINGGNATELKGYIARCRFFVGARTHATIAAYSSCIPTLVLGYSVKSRGIAQDLFSTDTNYVLPVQSLKTGFDLTNSFRWLVTHESIIQRTLCEVMPEYIELAKRGAAALLQLSK